MNRTLKRAALPIGAAVILGSSGFAFMANNTQAPSFAGSGTSTVSGYQVSPIHFNTSPDYGGDAYVQSIEFSLDNAADPDEVGAYIYSNYQGDPSRFTSCQSTNAADTAFKCTSSSSGYGSSVPVVTVGGVTKVVVTAAQ